MKHLIGGCRCGGQECEQCHELLCIFSFSKRRDQFTTVCKPCSALKRQEKRAQRLIERPAKKPRREIATPERIAELQALPYADYLQSPEWLARRKSALNFAGYRCMVCNERDKLNVHHRTYERLGCERLTDLVVLCEGCHALFHRNRKLKVQAR